ncbi:MAG: Hsp20/alpha crystallin family protein [Lewinella sp.]|uniref:Hsp20/alpha crystallin family protein n=1 Tax=Lewinella sp. TaxID=2004506 RepID=UPI003D6AF000
MCKGMKYHHGQRGRHHHGRGRGPMHRQGAPVNIQEMDDRYEIYLIAAGRKREDFKLDIADDLLTVHVTAPVSDTEGQWQRREFRFRAFERSFQLSDKINQEDIRAAYEGGVLTLTLPKHPDRVTQRREVEVE